VAPSVRTCRPFQFPQPVHRIFPAVAAHVGGRLQPAAKGGSFGFAENQAAIVLGQLDAAYAGGFAVRSVRRLKGYIERQGNS